MIADLIVIIDNWKYKPDGTEVSGLLSQRIINFIETHSNISTAVLSSYSCSEELFSNTVWYDNRRQNIRNYDDYVQSDYDLNLSRNMKTWEGMLHYVNPSIFQIAMRDIQELSSYTKSNIINNIYMSGVAWDICVKNRPLGYENIHRYIPEVNLLVDTTCILDSYGNTPDMSLYPKWKNVSNTLYQYFP